MARVGLVLGAKFRVRKPSTGEEVRAREGLLSLQALGRHIVVMGRLWVAHLPRLEETRYILEAERNRMQHTGNGYILCRERG